MNLIFHDIIKEAGALEGQQCCCCFNELLLPSKHMSRFHAYVFGDPAAVPLHEVLVLHVCALLMLGCTKKSSPASLSSRHKQAGLPRWLASHVLATEAFCASGALKSWLMVMPGICLAAMHCAHEGGWLPQCIQSPDLQVGNCRSLGH